MLVGFNATFFIQHLLGLDGMPRRVYTYPDIPDWAWMNLLSSAGTAVLALSVLAFLANIGLSLRRGTPAGDNPWQAWTLEWATTSPPPSHNFVAVPPVHGRRPLWDLAHPEAPDWAHDHKKSETSPENAPVPAQTAPPLQFGPLNADRLAGLEPHRLALILFLLSEAVFFAILILAYVYYRAAPATAGGPTAAGALDPGTTAIYTALLLASSGTIWRADRNLAAGHAGRVQGWLLATVALGAAFLVGQGAEYVRLIGQDVTLSTNLFGTTFFTLTGFHGFHVFAGLVMLGILAALGCAGLFKGTRHSAALSAISLYWHFVDGVWVILFAIIYLWR